MAAACICMHIHHNDLVMRWALWCCKDYRLTQYIDASPNMFGAAKRKK